MSCCIKAQVATSRESVMCFNVFVSCYGTVSYGKFLVLRDVFPASFGMAESFLVSPEKPGCQFPPIGEKETHQQQNSMENSSGRRVCAGGQHYTGEDRSRAEGAVLPHRRSGFHFRVGHRFPAWAGARHWTSGTAHFLVCAQGPQVCSQPTDQPTRARVWEPQPKSSSDRDYLRLWSPTVLCTMRSCLGLRALK